MARIVMKFGGTSVADIDCIRNVAQHVKREYEAGHKLVVVVSAMAGGTDRLVQLARNIALLHDVREYDTIVSAGEQISAGLLAMGLQDIGVPARSWLGWQLPIETSGMHGAARIANIQTDAIEAQFAEGRVAVLAGFQGVSPDGRIATLGRGGSDTSAVAIAAALQASRCDIYTDVDGVYTADPHIVPQARRLARISYEEMLESASMGTKILQTRSVELAMAHNVRLQVRSSFDNPVRLGHPANRSAKNDISADDMDDIVGTLICNEEEIMEQEIVSGIAYSRDEAKITLCKVADKPGVAARIFGPLADAAVNVDMIVQNISTDGGHTDITFTVPNDDLKRATEVISAAKDDIGYAHSETATGLAKISIVGIGMRSHAGVARKMFTILAQEGINIHVISTSEIKISVLIDADYTTQAMRALHAGYALDGGADAPTKKAN